MNDYSVLKIFWFPDKIKALIDGIITAPIYIRIKPTNKCCHKCSFCIYNSNFSSIHKQIKKTDEIPIEKMRELLFDIKRIGTKAVTYSGGGEPLMHKNILEILKITNNLSLDLSVLTNGQFLRGAIAEELLKAKWIRVSMDYFSGESFSLNRGTQRMFTNLVDNIKNFTNSNREGKIGVNFIITQENHKNLRQAIEFLLGLKIDNVRFTPVECQNFNNYHKVIKSIVLSELSYIKNKFSNDIEIYDGYSNNNWHSRGSRQYKKCLFMQIVPVIGADCNIYSCHNKAYSKEGLIGSIKNEKFSNLWFSKQTKDFFNSFQANIICQNTCTNDNKNLILHEFLNCKNNNFI